MRRIVNYLSKVLRIALVILLIAILLCNFYLLGMKTKNENQPPTIFGYFWAVVLSGSMEPVISVDDVIVAKAQETYCVGDIITYKYEDSFITHRIVQESENGFITRGDANNIEDEFLVLEEQVVGEVILIMPGFGKIVAYLKSPLGLTCIVLSLFAIVEVSYLLEQWRKRSRKKGIENKKEEV